MSRVPLTRKGFDAMRVSVIHTADDIVREHIVNKSVVMFDILRASSTISTALANGCQEVIPVVEVDEALAIASRLPEDTCILGGERSAVKLPGFHLGNSPLEYTPEVVAHKTVILTTTNGTKAIRRAAGGDGVVLIGSLLNYSAVAHKLFAAEQDILLACAGTRGKFSLEDTFAAGLVVAELVQLWYSRHNAAPEESCSPQAGPVPIYAEEVPVLPENGLLLEDAAVAALRLAEAYRHKPLRALYDALHGQKLAQMGLSIDLNFCAQLNLYDVVPVYREGKITCL
ncbi:2-phosphosulfolactate phosphatase [Desulforamulus ruminis]|uniref:2-phosphosulfolactate phosphatase n=1 Tax=Desulforamulus ruminis TaxID=1564 RepID=UPI002FD90ADC